MSDRLSDSEIARCLAGEFGPCIPWAGYVAATGYGKAWDGERSINAHRLAWQQANGPIPEGLVVRHLCANRICVNVDHLRIGSHSENQLDRVEHGNHLWANRTHCPQGHPYDEKNTLVTADGKRKCRKCESARRARNRRAEAAELRELRNEVQASRNLIADLRALQPKGTRGSLHYGGSNQALLAVRRLIDGAGL